MKALLFCLISITAFAQDHILVTPQWVNERKQDPKMVIIQSTFFQLDYEAEHIPGARYLWPSWLAPDSPAGAMNMPDAKTATDVLQKLGVNNNSYVVVYHMRNEVSPTARIFLTLENLGLKGKVHFLNGGLDAWKKAGYEVTKEIPVVKRGNFTAKPGELIVDKNYVLKSIDSDKRVIVDARAKQFYEGAPVGNPRDGHIKGALNIYYNEMLDQTSFTFKPVDSLAAKFNPVVPDKNKEIVTYCFIGQTASVIYMTGRILGYNMKLYDGSMQEWSRIPELPMEVTKK